MPQFLVVTRPERTSEDIAADRKEATAFFARYERHTRNSNIQRDLARTVAFYSHDWKLICCVIELSQWSLTHVHDSEADRAAARALRAAQAALNEIPPRDESQLRRYVTAGMVKRMPAPSVHLTPVGERLSTRGEAVRFWARCQNPTPTFRAAVDAEDVPFPQWLLLHPGYGPEQDAPDGYTGTQRLPNAQRYVSGKIRPAGITYDRALELALAAVGTGRR